MVTIFVFFQLGCSSNTSIRGLEYRILNFVIKGYHVHEITPPVTTPATLLPVNLEYTNITDKDATLVWIPPLESFSKDAQSLLTDSKKHLQLRYIAGLPIGHAPRGLGAAIREIIESGGTIHAHATGKPLPSFPHWPPVFEKGGVP